MSATLPTGRSGTSAVWDGSDVYIFGGKTDTYMQFDEYSGGLASLAEIVRYNPASGVVTLMAATLPSERAYTSAVWDGSNVYIFGGDGHEGYLDEIVRYHPGTDTVTVMAAKLPTARSYTSAVWDGSNAYIFGAGGDLSERPADNIIRYNPASDTLAVMSARLPETGPTSAVWDGSHAYVFGGDTSGEVVRYDPTANVVTATGAELPLDVFLTSAVWDGSNAYIFGGESESLDGYFSNQIMSYNPSSNSVALLGPTIPSARSVTSAAWDGEHAYVFGGDGADAMDEGVKLDEIVQFYVGEAPTSSAPSSTRSSPTPPPQEGQGETTGQDSQTQNPDTTESPADSGGPTDTATPGTDSTPENGVPLPGVAPLLAALLLAACCKGAMYRRR